MLDIGYAYYIVVLLIVTGILMFILDVKRYKKSKLNKERKFSSFMAWMNIVMGACLFVSWWSYQKWFW